MGGTSRAYGSSFIMYTEDFEIYSYQNGSRWHYNFLLMLMLLEKLNVNLGDG